MRKTAAVLLAILLLSLNSGWSQSLPSYYQQGVFLLASPGSFDYGLVGYLNPANLAFVRGQETRIAWRTQGKDVGSVQSWGIFSGTRNIGFGMLQEKFGTDRVTDYRFALSAGRDGFAFGMAYGWNRSNNPVLKRVSQIVLGGLIRPNHYLSLGFTGNFSAEHSEREGVLDIGIRPLGNPTLTLFFDTALRNEQKVADAPWSGGAVIRIVPGIDFVGRYFHDQRFSFGLSIDFGRAGFRSQTNFDANREFTSASHIVRAGNMLPSIFPAALQKKKRYIAFNLKGRVKYHRYLLFDKNVHPFYPLLRDIEAARDDPRVLLITLNLSSAAMQSEHAWEIREALKSAQRAGKKVLIFIDNADMTRYHLASVANWIVMDPEGMIGLPGYVMGRTFLKGTLDKLGLGFEEWRLFKYKSAVEVLSREKMSDPDREQRQAYIDDLYACVREDVSTARKLTPEQFDQIINEEMLFSGDEALKRGLVDTLGRWSALDEVIEKLTGNKLKKISRKNLLANALPVQTWGTTPKIAIVYGLGVCALDEGIKARWLERVFLRLAKRKDVRAVVFRVDSPGGDGMASDMVAEALRKCSEKKPVIVSQGQVAGSGGYWISMYGDTIVAGPATITGSIGVIGGWLYDKGFSQKLGMTADHVQKGKHADLGFGVQIPFLGTIPARNLTEEETEKVKKHILTFYDKFVKKVADGRHMPVERVREIAEGHFYSGVDGKEIGLVDEIGGLLTAIAIAKHKAGLAPGEEVMFVEIPKNLGLIRLNVGPASIGAKVSEDPGLQYLRLIQALPGKPLPLMPPGTYPVPEN